MTDQPNVNEQPTAIAFPKASLYAKIAAVTGDMRRIPKNGTHAKQGWKYPTWDDITQAINDALGKHNLAVIPNMPEAPTFETLGKNDNNTPSIRCSVILDFTLADGDTGETEVRRWYGWADDTSGGEKAIDKALTYCEKSFFKKLFVISAGQDDDPEGATSAYDQGLQRNDQQQPPQVRKPRQQPPPAAAPQGAMDLPVTTAVAPNGTQPAVVKNSNTFMADAKALGFSIEEAKAVLFQFGYPKTADGKLDYKVTVHDAMIGSLKAWKTFCDAYQAALPAGETLKPELVQPKLSVLGVKEPYTDQAVVEIIPLMQEHTKFVHEALLIMPYEQAKEVFTKHGLRWGTGKSELMLETLRSEVHADKLKAEIDEAGDPFDDAYVAARAEATGDLFEDILKGSSMPL